MADMQQFDKNNFSFVETRTHFLMPPASINTMETVHGIYGGEKH